MFYPAKPGVVGISEQDFAHHVVDSHGHTTSGDDDIVISGELFKKSAQLFWIIVALGNRGVCRAPGAHKACDHGAIGIGNLAGSERLTSRAQFFAGRNHGHSRCSIDFNFGDASRN